MVADRAVYDLIQRAELENELEEDGLLDLSDDDEQLEGNDEDEFFDVPDEQLLDDPDAEVPE